MKKYYMLLFIALFFLCGLTSAKAEISDFEDLVLDPNSYWKGSDESGGFVSGNAYFVNNYNTTWGSWDGFSYSNLSDPNRTGSEAQYNAITGDGVNGSNNYAVGYYSSFAQDPNKPTVIFQKAQTITGAYFSNSNYAYYSMHDGDTFAKKFEEGDWFKLTITGKNANDESTGSVDVLLAKDTDIVNTWIWTNLSSLGMVKILEFRLSSSDVGACGMNTPAYFCMDNLTPAIYDFEHLVLDPNSYWNGSDGSGGFVNGDAYFVNNYNTTWGSWDGFSYSNISDPNRSGSQAQYNSITGGGVTGSNTYAIGYYSSFAQDPNKPTIIFQKEQTITGAYFSNNNYAYYSMRDGDLFSNKFEEGDWFKLTITGKNANNLSTGSVEVLLAEGTNIINTWLWSDLSSLGMVKCLEFRLSSSDVGAFGMNTPAYFCMDNLTPAAPPISSAIERDGDSTSSTDEKNDDIGCFITTLRLMDQ